MHMQKISQTNDTEVSRVDIFLFTKLSTMISRQKKYDRKNCLKQMMFVRLSRKYMPYIIDFVK